MALAQQDKTEQNNPQRTEQSKAEQSRASKRFLRGEIRKTKVLRQPQEEKAKRDDELLEPNVTQLDS